MTDVTIRAGTVDEVVPLRLEVLGWASPTIAEDTAPSTVHLVAEVAGSVVGCASTGPAPFPLPDYHDGPAMRFWAVAVADGQQGRGVGLKLMEQVRAQSRGLGAEVVWANARESAIAFYLKQGFEEVGERFHDALNGQTDGRVVLRL